MRRCSSGSVAVAAAAAAVTRVLHACCGDGSRRFASSSSSSQHNDDNSSGSSRAAHGTRVALPVPPYGLPSSPAYEAERVGGYSTKWLLHDLPRMKRDVAVMTSPHAVTSRRRHGSDDDNDDADADRRAMQPPHLLPDKDTFWRSPPHEALTLLARAQPYDVTLQMIMQHSYFFLLDELPHAPRAPLPHRMYEDMMQCLTFASLQSPPEWQFALPQPLLRTLLCTAAYHCTVDRHYFATAQRLYRTMEQQQHTGAAMRSAWVYVCTAAGRLDKALACAADMAAHDMPFDEDVFALMQHPSLHVAQLQRGELPTLARGVMLQRRLCRQLADAAAAAARTTMMMTDDDYDDDDDNDDTAMRRRGTAAAVAVHAMFVYHALTLRHARKWDVLRLALERGVALTPRTLRLALDVFADEKGVRCGARTVRAFVGALVRAHAASSDRDGGGAVVGSAAAVLYVLLRVRKNELLPALAALPRVVFSRDEQDEVMALVQRRARVRGEVAYAAAAPLLHALVCNDEPARLMHELTLLAQQTTDTRGTCSSSSSGSGDRDNDSTDSTAASRHDDDDRDSVARGDQPRHALPAAAASVAAVTSSHGALAKDVAMRHIAALLRDVAALDAAALQRQRHERNDAVVMTTTPQQQQSDAAVTSRYDTDSSHHHVDGGYDDVDEATHQQLLQLERMRRQGIHAAQRLLSQRVLREQAHTAALSRHVATAWVHPGYRDDDANSSSSSNNKDTYTRV